MTMELAKLRGKEFSFWNEQVLLKLLHKTPGFQFCIDPGKFVYLEQPAIDEIVGFLAKEEQKENNFFSLPGLGFYILRESAVGELKLAQVEQTDYRKIHDKLARDARVKEIHLSGNYRQMEIPRDIMAIEKIVINHQIAYLLERQARVEDYSNFYMEGLPPVGAGAVIGSGAVIKGDSAIGEHSVIYANVYMENAHVGAHCTVLPGCVLRDSKLEENVTIGPYTHLRNGALVKKGAKMGNFVEMKKSVLGEGSKAMHLAYLGDAEIGEKVNIGAGTITCNYDGKNKNKTIIQDNVFVGSGTELVAPVTINKNSYVAAGSTITEDVPQDSLGVARQKQRNIEGWVKRKRG